MKKLLVVALALALALTASFAMAEDTIKIGVIGPMTGPAAVYGVAVANGAKIAADEINANPDAAFDIVIDVQDDEHDPEKGINAYNATLDNGSQMILGTVTTAPCIAVSAQAFEDRIFMLTPSASSADVTANKDNAFQVCFTDPAMGTAAAKRIGETKLGTKVAIIYNNADVYSTGIYQAFIAEAETQGLDIVSTTTFTDDTTDFSVQVTEAKNAGADIVFLPIYYTPASQILTEANRQEYAPLFFGVDGMDGILSVEGFDTSLAEGVMMLTPFYSGADNEQTKNFVAKYQELYGEVPNQFAANAYDGIYALYQACLNTGITADTTPEEACELLIAEFPKLQIEGITGAMTWTESGEVSKTPLAVVIKDGQYEVVE